MVLTRFGRKEHAAGFRKEFGTNDRCRERVGYDSEDSKRGERVRGITSYSVDSRVSMRGSISQTTRCLFRKVPLISGKRNVGLKVLRHSTSGGHLRVLAGWPAEILVGNPTHGFGYPSPRVTEDPGLRLKKGNSPKPAVLMYLLTTFTP